MVIMSRFSGGCRANEMKTSSLWGSVHHFHHRIPGHGGEGNSWRSFSAEKLCQEMHFSPSLCHEWQDSPTAPS